MKNKLFALAFFCSFSLNVISQVEHTCEVVQLKDRSLPEETITIYTQRIHHDEICQSEFPFHDEIGFHS